MGQSEIQRGRQLGYALFSHAKGAVPLTLTTVLQERQGIYHRLPLDCEKQTTAIGTPASSLGVEKTKGHRDIFKVCC